MLASICLLMSQISFAGMGDTTKPTLYHPLANAETEIATAVSKANNENKHVLIQAGGNWCSWCLRFNKMATEDKQIDSVIQANYIVYHLNYSPENYNKPVFAKFGFPQRFGFPVFIILDKKGNRIHTQNSVYLEEGKGYDKTKVMDFLKDWTPKTISPASYPNKK